MAQIIISTGGAVDLIANGYAPSRGLSDFVFFRPLIASCSVKCWRTSAATPHRLPVVSPACRIYRLPVTICHDWQLAAPSRRA
jgi:hypothetical protein